MAGHMGDVTRTVQNLEIVRIDAERELLLVKGAVPGAKGGHVIVPPAVKAKAKKGAKSWNSSSSTTTVRPVASVDASDALFGRDYNEALMHQVVVAFQANARQRHPRAEGPRARSSTRPRSRGARRAPAALVPA